MGTQDSIVEEVQDEHTSSHHSILLLDDKPEAVPKVIHEVSPEVETDPNLDSPRSDGNQDGQSETEVEKKT